jgi:hypothetical protein
LAGGEAAIFVNCYKPLQGCLLLSAKDLGSSTTFFGAGGPGGFKAAQYVSDGSLPASNLIGNCLEGLSLLAGENNNGTLL